jgi:hypothetical protein
MNIDQAEKAAKQTDYAFAAAGTKENPINWGDASAFYLEGWHAAMMHAAEICRNLGHGKLHLENQYSCEEAIRAGLIDDLGESQNETAAFRDALSELKRFIDGERDDSENIAAIINGALRLPRDVAAQPNEKS